MNKELDPTIIAYNERAGNFRFAKETASALVNEWSFGEMSMTTFDNVLAEPSLLQDKHVIGLGGDGTHGSLAKLNYEINTDRWYLALHAGTAGFIPRALDLRTKRRESPEHYAKRIIYSIENEELSVHEIPPGIITTEHPDMGMQEDIFLYSVGRGDPSNGVHSFIEKRRHETTRYQRYLLALRTFRKLVQTAPPLEVRIGDSSFQAVDALVIKQPFYSPRRFALPFSSQDALFMIGYGEGQPHINQRIAIDMARMMFFHRAPIAGGIIIQPVKQDETVVYSYLPHQDYTYPNHIHIDSELKNHTKPDVAFKSSDMTRKQFRIVKRKGTIYERGSDL